MADTKHEEFFRATRRLLDLIESQGRQFTPPPKGRESRDDAASRDERDQVFGDEFLRVSRMLEKIEAKLPPQDVYITRWKT